MSLHQPQNSLLDGPPTQETQPPANLEIDDRATRLQDSATTRPPHTHKAETTLSPSPSPQPKT